MGLKLLLKEPTPRVIGIPVVGIITAFLYNPWPFPWYEFFIAMAFVAVMWNGDYAIIKALRHKWPSLDDTHKRILTMVILICIYNITADYILCNLISSLNFGEDYWQDNPAANIAKNLGITAVIGTLYEAGYFFGKWKKQTIETEQIRSQHLKSELSVLKNQISPHFLFNSLNTLVTLIHENQVQASKFAEELSAVYRYILQFKDKELVKLQTEIKFVEAYIYLLKMRFEEGFDVSIRISEESRNKFIAPLTLQMLIENTVKHNIVSKSTPLKVDIYDEDGSSLLVRNNLQRKPAEGHSTFTGLENIKSRYSYLSDREVDIISTKDHFLVALPLIQLSEDTEKVVEEY